MLILAFTAFAIWSAGDPGPDSPWVITVESWVRPVEIRIPGPSEFVVVLFGVNRETLPKREWIERFAECTSLASIQAMALCDQPVNAVRRATTGWPERLSVGAGVRSPKLKHPGSLPQVLYYSESTGVRWMPADDETLGWICRLSSIGNREIVTTATDGLPQSADPEIESLHRLVRDQSEDVNTRIRALKSLRGRLPPERILALCDELLLEQPGEVATDMQVRAWWRGEVAYERHLSDPDVQEKQPELSVWQRTVANNLRHEGYKTALWPVAVYESAASLKPFARLQLDYIEHLGDEPDEVLIRDVIIRQIARRASPAQAKPILLQWLPLETDRSLAGSIASLVLDKRLYRDREVISALRDRQTRETDIRLRAYLDELILESEIRAAAE